LNNFFARFHECEIREQEVQEYFNLYHRKTHANARLNEQKKTLSQSIAHQHR
jgi:hypothetical protein